MLTATDAHNAASFPCIQAAMSKRSQSPVPQGRHHPSNFDCLLISLTTDPSPCTQARVEPNLHTNPQRPCISLQWKTATLNQQLHPAQTCFAHQTPCQTAMPTFLVSLEQVQSSLGLLNRPQHHMQSRTRYASGRDLPRWNKSIPQTCPKPTDRQYRCGNPCLPMPSYRKRPSATAYSYLCTHRSQILWTCMNIYLHCMGCNVGAADRPANNFVQSIVPRCLCT
jgi:hypothetical protein